MKNNTYRALTEHFQRLSRLEHAMTFLQWDQLVMMPPGGNESRSKAIAELMYMHHEMLTDPKVREYFEKLEEENHGGEESKSTREMRRSWRQAICVPADLVKAKSLAGSKCEHAWRTQSKNNDWAGFLDNFKEVVNLSRQEARARWEAEPGVHLTPYDALLDLYCTGDSTTMIGEVFSGLKEELPGLIQEVVAKQKKEPQTSLSGTYPIAQLKNLSHQLMRTLGFDFEKGRLDESMHPFSTGDKGDQRITTRYREPDFAEALQATAHETGHASYEGGLPVEWEGLPVGQARNMCIHESQSLLFEKQLFLSRPFIEFFTQTIHEHLPSTSSIDSMQMWRAFTKVEPSFIRVEADEVTYPMHVILRFEIESALINGTIEAKDIPETWDSKMQEYLGIETTGNYKDGCMQDIHWTDGSFGYFPSYTLGAVNAAQLFRTIRRNHTDWQARLEKGEVDFVSQWLAANIWSKGSRLESQELMKSATGEGTNAQYFLEHIRSRYLENQY